MADDCLRRLEEAMDRTWFHRNILSSFIQLSLGAVRKETRSSPPPPPPPLQPVTASEDQSTEKGRHHSYRKKRPTRLHITASDQLFQMPPSPLITSRCRLSSLPSSTENSPQSRNSPQSPLITSRRRLSSLPSSTENSPQSRNSTRRWPTKMMRSYKSFSELEQDELKGFMDLGFVFHKESLSPRMMSVIPGLQRLGKKANEQLKGEEHVTVKGRVRRPYLAEAWLIRRPDSPLLNLKMLPASSTEGADMKRQLRFWARTVASTIHQES